MRRTCSAAWGPKGAERVLPLDPVLVEEPGPVLADHDRARALGAHQHEADPGVVAERRQEPRVEGVQPLQGHPARLAREADQAEAAGGHHGELRDLVAVRLLDLAAGVGVERDDAVGAAPLGRDPHGARRHGVVARDLGQAGAQVGERVLVAPFGGDRAPGSQAERTRSSSVSP